MPSQSSLGASLLGALSIACVAFENVARTWVSQELPVYQSADPGLPRSLQAQNGIVHVVEAGLLSLRELSGHQHVTL